jgi:formylglycine-generating enzyme required for sulfatase activity
MGQVYLAEDTILDRPVAVKFILDAQPGNDARRELLAEARAVARLSHPNVLVVHRVGEVDDHPYLVTELLRGQTLLELHKPVPCEQAIAVGLRVARGLAAAHRKGVLHRDIKPENIMLCDDGGVKLLDFGLAILTSSAADDSNDGQPGTPLYMAPETLRGAPATCRSDVYSAGAVLYELSAGLAPREALPEGASLDVWIAGATPPLHTRAAGVDPRFAAIVDRCLDPDPGERFASADALGDALAAIFADGAAAAVPAGNPYRGLTPFDTEHRALFFGRGAESRAVLDRLRADGIVVVTGESGVGKSSLCRAGVLPLVADGALADRRVTLTATIVPGRRPLGTLTSALAAALALDEATLAAGPLDDHQALARRVRAALGPERGLVLFVDQLEELCTLADPDEAASFAEALAAMIASTAGVRALLTVRSDFFARLTAIAHLGEDLARSLYVLRPLSADGVRAAITAPALRQGLCFEPASFVDTLVDAARSTGGLPLLQFALAELWEASANSGQLTAEALDRLGGVSGALARHANDVLFGLRGEARTAARVVLLRLVTPERTRARRTARELDADQPAIGEAIEALVRGRLIVAGEAEGETAYELSHEALIAEWRTLGAWIEETHDQKSILHDLEQAAALWSRRGRRREETWTGDALSHAALRATRGIEQIPTLVRDFLDAGLERRRGEQRRRRLLIGASLGALALLTMASSAAMLAFRAKEQEAIRQQQEIRLAAADLGDIDLVLEPFDWDDERQRAIAAAAPPELDFNLYAASADPRRGPGRRYGDNDLRRSRRRNDGSALTEHIEARSGAVVLEIVGRGACGPSWISLQRLPGYTDRVSKGSVELRIPVPTCQASRAGTVIIPAGPFLLNTGAPEAEEGDADAHAELPAYAIDRREVTRAAFDRYAALEALTGDAAARTSFLDLNGPGGEGLPIVGLDAFTAERYCRFLGKELPTVDQWQKAMRGGLEVAGRENPNPKRLKPWSGPVSRHPANIEGGDAFPYLAPGGSFPEDTSPYGVVDMAGNVSEWSREESTAPTLRGLRVILGANWGTPPDHTGWRNKRPNRYLDFAVGARCVLER